jgi:acyl carrier protein
MSHDLNQGDLNPGDLNLHDLNSADSNRELTARVLRIIAETQRKDPARVTIDSSFEELGIDSMDGVNIVFALENEFDINVPDEEVKSIRNVRDMVEGVRTLVARRESESGASSAASLDPGPATS